MLTILFLSLNSNAESVWTVAPEIARTGQRTIDSETGLRGRDEFINDEGEGEGDAYAYDDDDDDDDGDDDEGNDSNSHRPLTPRCRVRLESAHETFDGGRANILSATIGTEPVRINRPSRPT